MPYEALPPDPFAGDPSDPSRMLDALGDLADVASQEDLPLDEEERDEVVADLGDLAVFQALLAPRGIRGVVVDCEDCDEQHFHDWDLLRASLQQLLEEGHMRPHEPPFDPDPASYVTWEYCRGFADATLAEQ
ncbi:DUF5319 domain-containing protein [Actinomycetospora sp. TBRC 11914]|uniref:DUF5319 domain-containing protein n=1 Tax=Actinomycetospora sp. TBRC 11914 TaxID=2729387 RepID=UPI00145F357A|nr:DUF5319 domain-containing protein [Actinomycetospora sp. TBRC 11914]NMO93460.1 DUF5319 domain-containing protein [Actinomycetospora sp. TBRC 11914]